MPPSDLEPDTLHPSATAAEPVANDQAANATDRPVEALAVVFGVLGLMRLLLSWPAARATGAVVPALLLWTPCILASLGRTDGVRLGLVDGNHRAGARALLFMVPILGFYAVAARSGLFTVFGFPDCSATPIAAGFGFDTAEILFFMLATELVFVALPEEFFFRGYVQGSIDGRGGSAAAIVTASFFFALAHVVATNDLRRFEVFIPGLLFGWQRRYSGSCLYPALAHALCNVVHYRLFA